MSRWRLIRERFIVLLVRLGVCIRQAYGNYVGTTTFRRFLNNEEENEEYGDENDHDEEVEHEEAGLADYQLSIYMLCIFLFLIALTVLFEKAKHYVQECAGRSMKPIVDSLFGELTVLGFLSACTFVLAEAGLFSFLSEQVYGLEEEEELLEIFEFVHFSLFFVMVVFVVNVLAEVKQGLQTQREWLKMDRYCRDQDYMRLLSEKKERDAAENLGRCSKFWHCLLPYLRFLPQMRNQASESLDDMLLFYSLREEFIKERSVEPPFRHADENNRVSDDFNFGRYLSVCLGKQMANVVHVDTFTWAFFAILGTALFCVSVAVNANYVIMSWVWVAIGYVVFFFNVYFEEYLLKVRKGFAPSNDELLHGFLTHQRGGRLKQSILATKDDKKTPLMPADTDSSSDSSSFGCSNYFGEYYGEALPGWCFIDINQYEQQRTWLTKRFSGKGAPNRHHALFWFEHNGPTLHLLILRINLVFIGVYCTMLALVFFPSMYRDCSIGVSITFLLCSAVPMLAIIFNKQHLVSTMVQVGAIGSFRRPQAIAQANREEKTAQAVRTLVIIEKLHQLSTVSEDDEQRGVDTEEKHYINVLGKEEIAELSNTFDLFDINGDKTIGADEFQELMSLLRHRLDAQGTKKLVDTISSSGTGEVSKEDFLQWYANQMGKSEAMSMKDRAHFVFEMFDKDGDGELSVSEFKETLDALKTNFTIDEVGELVHELDLDDNGVISEEEFVHLIERYYPKELNVQEDPSASISCHGFSLPLCN